MRPIHLVRFDKIRPGLILTRDTIRGRLTMVTVAPITSRIRGLSIEVPVGPANGLDRASVINCDNIGTIPTDHVLRQVGFLLPDQEQSLTEAIRMAFDLV